MKVRIPPLWIHLNALLRRKGDGEVFAVRGPFPCVVGEHVLLVHQTTGTRLMEPTDDVIQGYEKIGASARGP
jgi:hypothetical protein